MQDLGELDPQLVNTLAQMKREKVHLNERGVKLLLRPMLKSDNLRDALHRYLDLLKEGLIVGDTGANVLFNSFNQAKFAGSVELFHLLYEMDSNNIPSRAAYDALIQFHHGRKEHVAALRVFRTALIRDGDISNDSFLQAFHSAKDVKPHTLNEMRGYLSKRQWMLDTYMFNGMLETYSQVGNLDACMDIFNEMLQLGGRAGPNTRTYNILINYFGKVGEYAAARRLLLQMEEYGLKPDAHTWEFLISCHSAGGLLTEAADILEQAISSGTQISTNTFGVFVELCEEKNAADMRDKFALLMVEKGMANAAYAGAISGFAKRGDMRKCAQILAEMERKGVPVSAEVYGVLVSNTFKSGNLEASLQMMEELMNQGVSLRQKTYTEALQFYASKDVTACTNILEMMWQHNVEPELPAYESILPFYAKQGRVTEVKHIFEHIRSKDILPSTMLANVMLDTAGKNGDINFCESLLADMRMKGPAPDNITYNTLLMTYSRAGDHERMVALLALMKADGIRMNTVAYSIIIHFLGQSKDAKSALLAYDQMRADGVRPDATTYHTLILLLTKAGKLDESMQLFREMKANGLVPTIRLYTVLMGAHANRLDTDACEALLADMRAAKIEPDSIIDAIMRNVHQWRGTADARMKSNVDTRREARQQPTSQHSTPHKTSTRQPTTPPNDQKANSETSTPSIT